MASRYPAGGRMTERMRGACLALALAIAPVLPAAAQTPHHHQEPAAGDTTHHMPAAGLYDLGVTVTDATGARIDLAALKGRPAIATMFFASCPDVCPLMTERILQAERALPPAERDRLQVILISFDDRDTPDMLAAYRKAHDIESPRWTVATASPEASRALAAMLGIAFEKLPDGSYAHRATVGLVAANGEVLARLPASSMADPSFGAALSAMLSMNDPRNMRNKP